MYIPSSHYYTLTAALSKERIHLRLVTVIGLVAAAALVL